MNCPNCGNPVSNAAAFCSCCGEKIEAEPKPDCMTDAENLQELPTDGGQTDGRGKPKNKTKKSSAAKVLDVLLCAAVIVAVSVFGAIYFSKTKDSSSDGTGTTEDSNTTVHETQAEVLTGNSEPEYNDEEKYIVSSAKSFLESLVKKDLITTLELMGISPDEPGDPVKAYSFLKTVDVTGYEFVESQPAEGVFLVRVDISKSGSDLFPAGSALWNLVVSDLDYNIMLFKPAYKEINFFYRDDNSPPPSEAAFLCMNFSVYMNYFETTDDFNTIFPDADDTDTFSFFCHMIVDVLNLEHDIKRVDLEQAAEKTLGITEIDFKKCKEYNKDEDILSFDGHGGFWLDCSLSSERYNPLTKRHTVEIDYYSDTAYILKDKTVRYVVEENDDGTLRLISTKLLYDNGLRASGGVT